MKREKFDKLISRAIHNSTSSKEKQKYLENTIRTLVNELIESEIKEYVKDKQTDIQ